MTNEGADPVTGPLAQHWISIFAAGDENERPVILEGRKRKMSDGSRVSWCHEGD